MLDPYEIYDDCKQWLHDSRFHWFDCFNCVTKSKNPTLYRGMHQQFDGSNYVTPSSLLFAMLGDYRKEIPCRAISSALYRAVDVGQPISTNEYHRIKQQVLHSSHCRYLQSKYYIYATQHFDLALDIAHLAPNPIVVEIRERIPRAARMGQHYVIPLVVPSCDIVAVYTDHLCIRKNDENNITIRSTDKNNGQALLATVAKRTDSEHNTNDQQVQIQHSFVEVVQKKLQQLDESLRQHTGYQLFYNQQLVNASTGQ